MGRGIALASGAVARLLLVAAVTTLAVTIAVDKTIPVGIDLDLLGSEMRKLLGGLDVGHLLDVALGKNDIDFLEGAARGLGVEEVDDGNERAVHAGEEEVSSPADLVNHDRGNHDDEEVEHPVGAGRDGVGLSTGADGVDLGGIEPGEGKPSGTEEGDVGEETDSGTASSHGVAGDQAGEDEDHGKHLANGTDQEQTTATDALNDEPGDGSKDGVDDHVDTTQQHGHVVRLADRVLEENREVVDDGVATTDLLHNLRAGAKQEATEMLGLAAGEESLEGSALLAVTAGSTKGVDNKVALLDGLGAVDLVTAESSNDLVGVLGAAVAEKPSGRLGKEEHGAGDEDGEDKLESDRETPNEVIGTVRSAIVNPVGNQSAKGNDTTFNANEKTTVRCL